MKKENLKMLGVIGDPIAHSLSPLMHNAALAKLGLPFIYMPFLVKHEELKTFFTSLKARKITGLNVTIPHKQAVIPFMDSLSREAKFMGAVNTVSVKGGKLHGHNTDGLGFITSLECEAGFNVEKKNVILVGAGGAARAIAISLGLKKAREVLIVNRTEKKAHDLAGELSKKFKQTIFSVSTLKNPNIQEWSSIDLLVNATSMGMKGKDQPTLLPIAKLPAHCLVTDVVYTPLETQLLKKAKKRKLKTLPGWGMLLYQGAVAFEIFTNKQAPIEVMKEALLNALKEHK